jgi:Phage Tail Collar Domain
MSNNLPSATATAVIVLPLPYGSIISYMGSAASLGSLISQGWLQCDGSAYSSVTYPGLFAAISTTYGGNGSPNFNVPNLLGCFMRCIDPNGVVDPDRTTRTSPISGNSTQVGPVVGSRQGHQLYNHTHNWSSNFGQITKSGSDLNVQLAVGSPTGGDLGTQPTTNNDGGGAETRPVNVYAYFLMFAGLPQTGQ